MGSNTGHHNFGLFRQMNKVRVETINKLTRKNLVIPSTQSLAVKKSWKSEIFGGMGTKKFPKIFQFHGTAETLAGFHLKVFTQLKINE